MAFHINTQNKIKELLTIKSEWASDELTLELGVASNWPSKNKKELSLYGITLLRKEHKEHKGKGLKKELSTRLTYEDMKFKDNWSYDNWLQLRFLINQFHTALSIPVPFHIQGEEEKENDLIPFKCYEILQRNFDMYFLPTLNNTTYDDGLICIEDIKPIENFYNFMVSLKEELTTSKYNKREAKRIFIHMFNIIESYPILKNIETDKTLLHVVTTTFKDIHGYEPTYEQIQCIAKAHKFSIGALGKYSVASIQAEAGSSKSTIAVIIQALHHNSLPYITAITNKALNGIKNSKTISLLLKQYADIEIEDTYQIKMIKARAKEKTIPFIIVDESSQCGFKTRYLLETICDKVLYIGDQEQLPAIMDEQGVDFLYLHTLTKQYRFTSAEDDFQIKYSQLNKNKLYHDAEELFKTKIVGHVSASGRYRKTNNHSSGFEKYSDYTGIFNEHKDLIKSYTDDNHTILAYSNNAINELNYIANGDSSEIKIGSKVMLITNMYDAQQFNGFQYRVINKEKDKWLCQSLETGESYYYNESDLILGFAVTTMKIQGSQIDHVLGISDTFKPYSYIDRYVIATRAKLSIRFIQALSSATQEELSLKPIEEQTSNHKAIQYYTTKLSNTEEGNRNNTLFGVIKDLIKDNIYSDEARAYITDLMLVKGLHIDEINSTIQSGINSALGQPGINTFDKSKTVQKVTNSKEIEKKISPVPILADLPINKKPRLEQWYTPVFVNRSSLPGAKRTLTIEQATNYQYLLYVAEELKGSNRIVIDCDSKETVAIFKDLINTTESYMSPEEDKLHLVYTTDRIVSTQKGIIPKLDFLGNRLYQLRNIKSNKSIVSNLPAIPITQDILNRINTYLESLP